MTKKNPPPQSLDKLWDGLTKAESAARNTIYSDLHVFEDPLRKCMVAGVQVLTLPAERRNEHDIIQSALFLKRALNDLRSVWLLTSVGYTSQAASVATSLVEHALLASCMAGHPDRAEKYKLGSTDDLPWSVKDMIRFEVKETKSGKEFEIAWRQIYSAYKWLCKIKHPTYKSGMHDAHSAKSDTGQYIVMALPDTRPENKSVKFMILTISTVRTLCAIDKIRESLKCDESTDTYVAVKNLLDESMQSVTAIFDASLKQPLPFILGETALTRELLDLHRNE